MKAILHLHYNRNNDSSWNLNNKQDMMMENAKHKSCHYCFVAAIQGPNLQAPNADKIGIMAGLVPGSIRAFLLISTAGYKRDYHKVFNGDNYLHWWTNQLLLNLTQFSIIILENAKYHVALGAHILR